MPIRSPNQDDALPSEEAKEVARRMLTTPKNRAVSQQPELAPRAKRKGNVHSRSDKG
jgi:hypothetical protein